MQSKFLATVAIAAALTGCAAPKPMPPIQLVAPTEEQKVAISKAIAERLKDPESARFGKIVLLGNQRFACAEVNAKNAFGGYTGTQVAGLMRSPRNTWDVGSIEKISIAECLQASHQFSHNMQDQ